MNRMGEGEDHRGYLQQVITRKENTSLTSSGSEASWTKSLLIWVSGQWDWWWIQTLLILEEYCSSMYLSNKTTVKKKVKKKNFSLFFFFTIMTKIPLTLLRPGYTRHYRLPSPSACVFVHPFSHTRFYLPCAHYRFPWAAMLQLVLIAV